MGRISSAHGIRGWIKIQPFTEHVDGLLDYETWWIGKENGPWREVKVLQGDINNKSLLAQFPDCQDRNAAEKLKGFFIAVPRSQLPRRQLRDEFYWTDLIGLKVVNNTGTELGVVGNLLETGANQVLAVESDNGEILIPFIANAIKQVDLKNRVIHVDWIADY